MTLKKSFALFSLFTVGSLMLTGCPSPSPDQNTNGGTTGDQGTTGTAGTTGANNGTARPAVTAPPIPITGDKIKVGLVASQTGDLQPWGLDSVEGAKLAVNEINAAGGIDGKQIDLIIEDTGSAPEQGKTAADRLVSQGVITILGEVASGITKQVGDVAYKAGVPVIAIGATKTDLTDIGANIFRVCYTDAFQGPVMARFAYEELGLRNIAVMTDQQQPYSTGLSESFKTKFESLGGKIVSEEFYKSKDTQFTSQLTNIKGKNPDGLFLSGYFTEVGLIAREVKQQGLNVKLLGGDGWDSEQLLTSGGEGIIGGYFCNHYNNREERPEVVNFLDKWKKAHGGKEPATTMGALGYDAAMLAADAIKRATTKDTKGINDAIDNTENFSSVSGSITLKGHGGNPPKRALVVKVAAEGQVFAKAYEYFN